MIVLLDLVMFLSYLRTLTLGIVYPLCHICIKATYFVHTAVFIDFRNLLFNKCYILPLCNRVPQQELHVKLNCRFAELTYT